jgi:hypothetical protein
VVLFKPIDYRSVDRLKSVWSNHKHKQIFFSRRYPITQVNGKWEDIEKENEEEEEGKKE